MINTSLLFINIFQNTVLNSFSIAIEDYTKFTSEKWLGTETALLFS